MKSYKDFEKKTIGYSDIAMLVLVGCDESGAVIRGLEFGEDGFYNAYMVKGEEVEIGDHYQKVTDFCSWFKIYDDGGLTYTVKAERITVYRAGDFGCIIQTINERG